uniref:HesA/MoeB/ThiF family protein n=1 Tax=Geoglobus ahangari TaxID=113653 RepID=A0A7J3TJH4_9EURY
MLNRIQMERYSRQIKIPEVGVEGQEKLLKSKVLIIGAGGLGSSAIQFLAAAGIGRLGIVDYDRVDTSNLQRQTIHARKVGLNKAVSAKIFVKDLNEDVKVDVYPKRIEEIPEIIKKYDIVLDCTDNLKSKFFINDLCVRYSTPYVHASAVGFMGEIMTVIPKTTACYRCVFKTIPKEAITSEEFGVISAAPGVIGAMQALEAIKYLLGLNLITNRLLYMDFLSTEFVDIRVERDPNCPVCGTI